MMELALYLLVALVYSAAGAPSGVPVMQLSAQDPASEDPYVDGITIFAEPSPYQMPQYTVQQADVPNTPNFRFGLLQQALAAKNPSNSWYQPTNAAGGGILHDHFGNKIFFSSLGQLFQNLPTLPLTANVPDIVNSVANYFSTSYDRFQQFLTQAQQSAAQLTSSAQNIKGDELYQYGTPPHSGFLSQLLHQKVGGGYFKNAAQPEVEQYAQIPVYQVIAVMPMYNSPSVKVSDYLRQRSMNFDRTELTQKKEVAKDIPDLGAAVESSLEKEVAKEMTKDMAGLMEVDEIDVANFAKDVAKEVASAVSAAARKPGKVTEVVVRVDATDIDDDSDEEEDEKVEVVTKASGFVKTGGLKKPDDAKKTYDDKKKEEDSKEDSNSSDSSDSSDSSESSESTEIPPPTPPPKKEVSQKLNDKKKVNVPQKAKVDEEEGGESSEQSSEELDSVEKVARMVAGARPLKAELEYSLMKDTKILRKSS